VVEVEVDRLGDLLHLCSRGQVVVPGAEAEEISQPGARERNEALQDEGGQIIRGMPTGAVDDGPASEDSDRVLSSAAGLMLRQIHQVARGWDQKETPTAPGASDTCDDDLIAPPALRAEGPSHDQFLTLVKCLTAAQVVVAGGAHSDNNHDDELNMVDYAPFKEARVAGSYCVPCRRGNFFNKQPKTFKPPPRPAAAAVPIPIRGRCHMSRARISTPALAFAVLLVFIQRQRPPPPPLETRSLPVPV
jgi:hypothetical protein